MKSIASTLRLALALASLSFGLNSAFAADSPVLKPQGTQNPAIHNDHFKGPSFTSGFVFEKSGALTIGKLVLAAGEKHNVSQILSSLHGTSWKTHCLMIDKAEGIKMSYFLVPASGSSPYGMIGLFNISLARPDTDLSLVNSVAGSEAVLTYENGTLKVKMPSISEPIEVVTKSDVEKHTASLKTGTSGLAAASKPAGQ